MNSAVAPALLQSLENLPECINESAFDLDTSELLSEEPPKK